MHASFRHNIRFSYRFRPIRTPAVLCCVTNVCNSSVAFSGDCYNIVADSTGLASEFDAVELAPKDSVLCEIARNDGR